MSRRGTKRAEIPHQSAADHVHPCILFLRTAFIGLIAAFCVQAAGQNSAADLARAAKAALADGQIVRAYLLYSRAAAEDPHNLSYTANRDALSSAAKILGDAHLESATADLEISGEGLDELSPENVQQEKEALFPPPKLAIPPDTRDFNLTGDDKSVITRVAQAFGIEAIFDPAFEAKPGVRFELDQAPFRTAMRAVTDATDTFVFPVSAHRIFVARDTQQNRNEYEPQSIATISLPDAADPREVAEAANAVRGALGLKGQLGIDTAGRAVIIRDRVSKVRVAQSILERLLLPRPQLALHIQLMEVDNAALYHYGIAWQTSFQMLPLGGLSKLRQPILPSLFSKAIFLPFGGGFSLFGIGIADANLFAMFTQSSSRILYDATMRAGDGQAASLHFGEKYPMPTSLSTASFSGAGAGIYSPLGQVTQEDLGLEVKVTPHAQGNGNIDLDIEAQYQTLGSLVLNTVPSINQRQYKGNLVLPEGQWAIVSGVVEDESSVNKNGIPGLGDARGLDLLFAETTRSRTKTQVLLVIKPRLLTPAPVADYGEGVSLGPANGDRLVF